MNPFVQLDHKVPKATMTHRRVPSGPWKAFFLGCSWRTNYFAAVGMLFVCFFRCLALFIFSRGLHRFVAAIPYTKDWKDYQHKGTRFFNSPRLGVWVNLNMNHAVGRNVRLLTHMSLSQHSAASSCFGRRGFRASGKGWLGPTAFSGSEGDV